MDVKIGTADVSVGFAAFTTATGAAVTVTSATAGLALWYRRDGGLKVALSSVNDLSALDDAHNDEGILVIAGQEHRLDLPDAAFASGVSKVQWGGSATGITIDGGEANLVAYDPSDAVRMGLTALPNAAADAAGGLPISDAGELDMDALAQIGDEMDLVDAPNPIAIAAFGVATAQQTRDAMKLAPTAGDPAAGSVDKHLDDIKVKTDTLGVASVTVSAPVASGGQLLVLVRGDDYLAADGLACEWASSAWPDLTDATIDFTARDKNTGAIVIETVGVVDTAGSGEQIVTVDLTTAQTRALSIGTRRYLFDVQATLASGSIVTLSRGSVNVYGDQTR